MSNRTSKIVGHLPYEALPFWLLAIVKCSKYWILFFSVFRPQIWIAEAISIFYWWIVTCRCTVHLSASFYTSEKRRFNTQNFSIIFCQNLWVHVTDICPHFSLSVIFSDVLLTSRMHWYLFLLKMILQLNIWKQMVTVCTTFFNIKKPRILFTECTYATSDSH